MEHQSSDPAENPAAGVVNPKHSHPAMQSKIADFVESLRKKESYCLGFIPAQSYMDAIKRDRLLISTENDEPCGFVLWAKRKTTLRFHQTAVVADARRVKHATDIVCGVLSRPEGKLARCIRLRVADDLPANRFWSSIGFKIVGNVPGGKTWGRTINIYNLDIRNRMDVAMGIIEGNLAGHQKELAAANLLRHDR